MKKTILLATMTGLAVLTLSAQKPALVLPTIHSRPILQVCFSADNRFMATSAGTEEIKLWEQKTGRLIRTVQTPLPVSNISLSKDGARLVCGTYCGVSEYTESADGVKPDINTEVQVWDMVSGKKLRTLKALGQPIRIEHVEISDDGNLALATFKEQITVWDVRSGAEKWTIEGWGIGDFCPDGANLLLNQNNGTLSLVDCNNGQQTPILNDSCALYACQSDAVVMLTKGMVLKRWDIRSKSFSAEVAVGLEADYFGSYPGQDIRFSQDGTQLGVLNTVDFNTEETYGVRWQFRSFDANTGKFLTKRDTMEYDNGWGFLTPDFKYFFTSPLVDVADVRAGMSAYSIATGKFSHYFGLKLLEATTDANMIPPDFRVYNQGKLILVQRDRTTARPNLLFLPERGEAISGVEMDSLKFFAENQTLTEDKRWRLECKDNLSYQLSDAKSGQLVATLLLADVWPDYSDTVFKDVHIRIWAVTTPSGLFDASPEMMESLHYVQGMEIIELSQLKTRYYEPYLLQKIMGIMPGGLRPVDELNNVPLYPEILDARIENDLLKVKLKPRSGGIGKVALELDGFELVPDVNPARKADFQLDLKPYLGFFTPNKPNHLSLKLYNEKGWLESQSYMLKHRYDGVTDKGSDDSSKPRKSLNEQSDADLEKIHFYALVIGTSKYRDESLNLKYPEKDAAMFADALRKAGAKLFEDRAEVVMLSTETEPWPRKAEIRKALRDIAAKAGPNDILLVYFSGHGITYPPVSEDGQFYYLTTDIAGDNLKDEAILKTQAIAQDSLMDWVRQIKARKRILIYDACNSGGVVKQFEGGSKDLNTDQRRALERMKDRTGMYVLAGSAADKSSFEASNYGHGLLTYSLINGMLSVAAKNNKFVELGDLFAFVEDDVERLAKNINREQRPEVIKAESYPIGIIDKNSGIKMPTELPVFVQTGFTYSKRGKDLLEVSAAFNDELNRLSTEKNPSLAFWDIASFSGKYFYLGGEYQEAGDNIAGTVYLYEGNKELHTFPFSGSKANLGKLAKDIVFEVREYLLKNPGK